MSHKSLEIRAFNSFNFFKKNVSIIKYEQHFNKSKYDRNSACILSLGHKGFLIDIKIQFS